MSLSKSMPSKADQDILESRARRLAAEDAGSQHKSDCLRVVVFSLGRERLAVDARFVQEVRPLAKLMWSAVPCTPDFIVGVVNVRGRIYSLMNIALFLGIETQAMAATAHIVRVKQPHPHEKPGMELCFYTDDVPRVVDVALDSIQDPETALSRRIQPHVMGVTAQMLTILKLERVLADPAIVVDERPAADI